MILLKIAALCIFCSWNLRSVVGTLAQSKSISEQQTPRLNKITKLILKDKEVEIIVTPPPPVPSTTIRAVNNEATGNIYYDPVAASSKTNRFIELAIVMGGVTIMLMILAATIRTCFFLYEKTKNLTSQSSASVVYRSSPHLHPRDPIPPRQIGTTGGTNIYTVMPGHFLLQPCFTSRSSPSVTVEGSASRHIPYSPESTRDENPCVVTVIRPETPPPPYPGLEK